MSLLRSKVQSLVRSVVDVARMAVASLKSDRRAAAALRADGLRQLNGLSRQHGASKVPAAKKVLVDGTWDNANYWTRYAIVRQALALNLAVEVGMLGKYSRRQSRSAFAAFGIDETIDLKRASRPDRYLGRAKALLRDIRSSDDLIRISLPCDFPPQVFFDGVLKRQRRSTVDVTDPKLPEYIAEAMAGLDVADAIVAGGKFDLVILSHTLDYTYGAIAWAAIRHGIPVLTLYGDFGHARFLRLKAPSDLFMFPGRPSEEEITGMPCAMTAVLRKLGAEQLAARLSGSTSDVGAIYAYRLSQGPITREQIASRFGWHASRPTIGVYSSNWFDYPHVSGMCDFRDFLDWISATLEVAKSRPEVNWLFKAHPCDDWYGKIHGQRLEDLVAAINQQHIRLADKNWNGLDMMQTLDGIVTCHGTIGIEATSRSIPVLVPYSGWYGHAGFVTCASDRDDYLSLLRMDWWQGQNLEANKEKAELFAAWMFCVPDWHGQYKYHDDSKQDEIYADLTDFLRSNRIAIAREADEVAAWFADGHPYFHVFVMMRAKGFQLGDI